MVLQKQSGASRRFSRLFVLYLAVYSLIVAGLFWLLITTYNARTRSAIIAHEQAQVILARKSVQRALHDVITDIRLLFNNRHISGSRDRLTRKQLSSLLSDELASFLQHKSNILSARIIDPDGRELLRIDRKGGKVVRVHASKLQDKHDRYYVKAALAMPAGHIYVSPLDLNIEHGKLQQPLQPVIRFATAMRDNHGKPTTLIFVNYSASGLLRHFTDLTSVSHGHVSLLNRDGYWMVSHIKQREWGFMLGHNRGFPGRHPGVWSAMQSSATGKITRPDGIFNYTRVYPFAGLNPKRTSPPSKGERSSPYRWYIVSDVGNDVLDRLLIAWNQPRILLAGLFLLLIGAVISGLIAGRRAHRILLRKQRELHATIFDSTTDGVIITDPDARILTVNKAFTRITGYSEKEATGKTPAMLSSGNHNREFYKNLWKTLLKTGHWEGEIENRRKDGSLFHEHINISAQRDSSGTIKGFVGIFSDISQHKLTHERLRKHAHYDHLTGLANRLLFHDRLTQAIAHAQRNDSLTAILFIDLDNFKPVNDRYGHEMGDKVLREAAQRIATSVRAADTAARLGGDEFGVILSDIRDISTVTEIVQRMLAAIQAPITVDAVTAEIGASIGIAIYPYDGSDSDTLVKLADRAMYRVKHTVGNDYEFFSNPDRP